MSGCGESPHEPLATIDELLEVSVLDDTVEVTHRLNGWVRFAPRLRIHNRSTVLALRWGGCNWLDVRNVQGLTVEGVACAAMASNDDRPVLQPGETVELDYEFDACSREDCSSRIDLGALDGEHRLVASFGSDVANGMRTLTGVARSGRSASNAFAMRLVE